MTYMHSFFAGLQVPQEEGLWACSGLISSAGHDWEGLDHSGNKVQWRGNWKGES